MFIDGRSRRLGDLAAGTLVVQERATLSLASLASKPVSAGAVTPEPAPVRPGGLPVERLSREDIRMAEDFLHRRDNLTNRAPLAQRLAQVLAERMQLPAQPLTSAEAEQLIADVVQASQGRGRSNSD
jgi:hypothetical protein